MMKPHNDGSLHCQHRRTRRNLLFLPVVLVLLLVGCAHSQQKWPPKTDPFVCKHCNCYMSAQVAPESACTACGCGATALECYEGT